MDLEAHAASDIGNVRERNEDSHLVDESRGVFALADGMGGRLRGDVASQIFIETLQEEAPRLAREAAKGRLEQDVEQRDRALQLLTSTFLQANREIYNTGQGEMGTTGAALIVADTTALLAHVGDSRIYLLRDGQLQRLTTDHTYAARKTNQSNEESRPPVDDPHSHVLTRSLGNQPHAQVDTLFVELQPGDQFLLCTDGVTGALDEPAIAEHLETNSGSGAAATLVEQVRDRGGLDNATAILVELPAEAATQFDDRESIETTDKVEVLRHIEAFSGLDDRTILQVMRYVYQQDFAEGEMLIERGTREYSMYMIISGEVSVQRDGDEITRLGAGEHIGEMALVDRHPRSADVIAVEPVRTLALGPEDFTKMVRQTDPKLGNRVLWNMLHHCIRRLRED
jgi:serine/threonine protein phosphatase PrpC